MDEEEAGRLIELLQQRFRAIGEPGLADQDNYVSHDPERGMRRLPPRERLAQMIEAFERVMMLDDVTTYKEARLLIGEATGGEVPRARIIPFDEESGEARESFTFEHLAYLADLRERLIQVARAVRSGEVGRFGVEE